MAWLCRLLVPHARAVSRRHGARARIAHQRPAGSDFGRADLSGVRRARAAGSDSDAGCCGRVDVPDHGWDQVVEDVPRHACHPGPGS